MKSGPPTHDNQERALPLDERYEGPWAAGGYYYVATDSLKLRPLCPTCFEGLPRKISLMGTLQKWKGGTRRACQVCDKFIYETPRTL